MKKRHVGWMARPDQAWIGAYHCRVLVGEALIGSFSAFPPASCRIWGIGHECVTVCLCGVCVCPCVHVSVCVCLSVYHCMFLSVRVRVCVYINHPAQLMNNPFFDIHHMLHCQSVFSVLRPWESGNPNKDKDLKWPDSPAEKKTQIGGSGCESNCQREMRAPPNHCDVNNFTKASSHHYFFYRDKNAGCISRQGPAAALAIIINMRKRSPWTGAFSEVTHEAFTTNFRQIRTLYFMGKEYCGQFPTNPDNYPTNTRLNSDNFLRRPQDRRYLGGSASLFGITWKVSVAIFVARAFGQA